MLVAGGPVAFVRLGLLPLCWLSYNLLVIGFRLGCTVLFLVLLILPTVAVSQKSGIGADLITQEVVLVSIDYAGRFITVRDPKDERKYGTEVEENTKLKAGKRLIDGRKKAVFKDFGVGDHVRLKIYFGNGRQELREMRLLRKAISGEQ